MQENKRNKLGASESKGSNKSHLFTDDGTFKKISKINGET